MGWATLSAAANRVAFNRLGGVSVTAGATSGMGILNRNAELVQDGQVISVEYHLTVETALFGGLVYGDVITVGAEQFVVRQAPMMIGDGTDCFVLLEKMAVIGNTITTISGLTITTLAGVPLITL
jgi:hypothetical protein